MPEMWKEPWIHRQLEKAVPMKPSLSPLSLAMVQTFSSYVRPAYGDALSEGLKRMTREEACAWLAPVRCALYALRIGVVETIHGYAVTRDNEHDSYARIDYCIAGFRGLIARLWPELSLAPLERVEKRLANGVPLEEKQIDDCFALLKIVETRLPTVPYQTVKSAVLTEQIDIEMSALGLKP